MRDRDILGVFERKMTDSHSQDYLGLSGGCFGLWGLGFGIIMRAREPLGRIKA